MLIVTIVGARPQFVKAAPVSREIRSRARIDDSGLRETLIHTGQHYDYEMSAAFFHELGIPEPAHHLEVGSGRHGEQTGEMLKRLESVLLSSRPDVVLVYGDTNSTIAGALAAAKLHIPVAHVEAGLRSFDRRMPEEVNRVVTDHLSDYLFCPSEHSAENLRNEGITTGVQVVGDVMRESFLEHAGRAFQNHEILREVGLESDGFFLVTIHRPENTDDLSRLSAIIEGLQLIAQSGHAVVFPAHPRTRAALEREGMDISGLRVLPPVSYEVFLSFMTNARAVLTDSGGVQKEACWANIPCVTFRTTTEWIETVEGGWNRLVPCDPSAIKQAAIDSQRPSLPGDGLYRGKAAAAIVQRMAEVGG